MVEIILNPISQWFRKIITELGIPYSATFSPLPSAILLMISGLMEGGSCFV
jgi:hypothetical protein